MDLMTMDQMCIRDRLYTLQFFEMLGDSPNKTQRQQITVERLSGTWQITAVSGDTDYYTLLPSEE